MDFLVTISSPLSALREMYISLNTDLEHAMDEMPQCWPHGTKFVVEPLEQHMAAAFLKDSRDAKMKMQFAMAHRALKDGKEVRLVSWMGSCHCGDTLATMNEDHIKSHGSYPWQNYEGPVADCKVGYGMSVLAKALVSGVFSVDSQGGMITGHFQCTWVKGFDGK